MSRGKANSSGSLNRLNTAKAMRQEIENKKLLGLLVPYEEVYPMVSTMMNQVVSQFQSFGTLMSHRLVGVDDPIEIKRIVDEERDKIFKPFADYGQAELARIEDEKRISEIADQRLLLEANKKVNEALLKEEDEEDQEEDNVSNCNNSENLTHSGKKKGKKSASHSGRIKAILEQKEVENTSTRKTRKKAVRDDSRGKKKTTGKKFRRK